MTNAELYRLVRKNWLKRLLGRLSRRFDLSMH